MIDLPKTNFAFPTFAVGGYVRDAFMGRKSKDLDLVMEAPSFEAMVAEVSRLGGKVYQERPEFQVVRGSIPGLGAVDIALPRMDGDYSNGRHPDSTVVASSIIDDLSRRDFTINAIAVNLNTSEVVDPFGGEEDIKGGRIRTVGEAHVRFAEDRLRVFRALRFSVVLDFLTTFEVDESITVLLSNPRNFENVSTERIFDEVSKMFRVHQRRSMELLTREFPGAMNLMLERGIWLKPSLEKR